MTVAQALHDHAPDWATGHCVDCGEPATVYDRLADYYDAQLTEAWQAQVECTALLARTMLWCFPKRGDVVDLACGTGAVSAELVREGWRVHGVDASAPMLAIAAGRLTSVTLASAVATGLPSGSQRAVLSTWSHGDLPWPALVAEAHRLLRPGGMFVYVGGDPARDPGRRPDGLRNKVGAVDLTRDDIVSPFATGWTVKTRSEYISGRLHWPLIGLRAQKGPDPSLP